jgi:pimeloyl-ACP methyl ester carboxylesterase
VIKINRNNLHETCTTGAGNLLNCWTGGTRHADDLIERAKAARAQGYKQVVAAGQSFGGAISVEANARAPELFWAVMATSPGHGSDAADASASRGIYYTLDKQLLDVLAAQRSGRLIVSLPPFDVYSPNRDSDPIWPKARTVLQGTGRPFVLLGDDLPINGHGAATTSQFAAWFGGCLRDFVDPARTPAAGETKCPPPSQPLSTYLLPRDLRIPAPGVAGADRFLGSWTGILQESKREVLVAVTQVSGGGAKFVYAGTAGPKKDQDMFSAVYVGKVDSNHLRTEPGGASTFDLALDPSGQTIDFTRIYPNGTKYTATLRRHAGNIQ